MTDTVTLQQMLADAGTSDPGMLAHAIAKVAPGVPPQLEDFPADVWDKIKADVAQHIAAHRDRYRVHALPGGGERIESDKEYAYNQRINHAVNQYAKTKKYGDETQADRLQRINEARKDVRDHCFDDNGNPPQEFIDRLAFINAEYWNRAPYDTYCAVMDGSEDLSEVA